jgi:carboxynorspermidine decarboxylase
MTDLPCSNLDFSMPPSPAFVVDLACLRKNLAILADVKRQSGCKILLAQKAFSLWHLYPMIAEVLDGTCSSGPWEAMLARDHFQKEIHVYSPAFTETDMAEILPFADHLSFNSVAQWKRHQAAIARCGREIGISLRINPEVSTGEVAMYDPCALGSRLGIPASELEGHDLSGLHGLHFHALCEQGSDALEATLEGVEARFGKLLHQVKWLNMGGGHHITKEGYDIPRLVRLIKHMQAKYDLEIYLEPGEAIAIGTGVLVSEVVDLVRNGMDIAILDVSVTCHMPDCLEMPYRPEIRGAGAAEELEHTYRLGGGTCLAGDVISDYSFPAPLAIGQRLVFEDMSHYTMVKTTMFNGVKHPAICAWDPASREFRVLREFTYQDFRSRLG